MADLTALRAELERRKQEGYTPAPQEAAPAAAPPTITAEDIRSMRRDTRPPTGPQDAMTGFTSGIMDILRTASYSPIGSMISGGESQYLIPESAVPEAPDNIYGRAGELAGQTAVLAPFAGAAAAQVPLRTGATGAARIPAAAQNLVSRMGTAHAQAPVRTALGETALGASAGAVGFLAEQEFEGSQAARTVGEIIGGIAPAMLPGRVLMHSVGRFLSAPFSEIGSWRRAGQRVQRSLSEEQRLQAIAELESVGHHTPGTEWTIDPETGRPVLTPAQMTGDPDLIDFQAVITASRDNLRREADEHLARANTLLQQELRRLGGDPDAAARTIESAQREMRGWLDNRLLAATKDVDAQLRRLGARASREDANRLAFQAIDKVEAAGRQFESQLYSAIPPDTPVPAAFATRAYMDAVESVGAAQLEDIPEVARRLLDPRSETYLGNTGDGGIGITNIKELRSLSSKLRQEARNARAYGSAQNMNKARIADDLADAITDDIQTLSGADEEVARAVSAAVGFSREMSAFRRGELGKLLGRDAHGAARIREGLTLEQTIAGGGPKSREVYDEILGALDNPAIREATGGGSEEFVQAAHAYTIDRFLRAAAPGGELNTTSAQVWLRNNEELLSRMPQVQQEIQQVLESGEAAALAARQRGRLNFEDARISKATMLTQRGPVETWNSIRRSGSPTEARREAKKLMNMAARDASGEATAGVKAGLLANLIEGAKSNQRDIQGNLLLSGMRLRDALRDPATAAAAREVLTPGEFRRLENITKELIAVERTANARAAGEVIDDTPARALNALAAITGAASGRRLGRMMNAGGTVQIPGITSRLSQDLLATNISEPAERLLRDAVMDRELYRDLLMAPLTSTGELLPKGRHRLRAWQATVAAETAGSPPDFEQEFREEN